MWICQERKTNAHEYKIRRNNIPTYVYSCSNTDCECDTFETVENIKDDPLKICPFCNQESISRVPQQITVIDATPKTVGSLADKNYHTIGNYRKEDLIRKNKEDSMRASKYLGKVPDGATSVDRKPYIPPWRKTEKVDKDLVKLTKPGNEAKLQKFIMTGKKNV